MNFFGINERVYGKVSSHRVSSLCYLRVKSEKTPSRVRRTNYLPRGGSLLRKEGLGVVSPSFPRQS